MQIPLNLLYRGTLYDTAMIAGLVHTRRPIQSISVLGEMDLPLQEYCSSVSKWLEDKGISKIALSKQIPETATLICPSKSWGWGKDECIAMIRLSGLPLPPSLVCPAS